MAPPCMLETSLGPDYMANFSPGWNSPCNRPFCPPIWRPDNIVNIRNLLWPSSRLIILTEPENIYTSTFPNTWTSKMAKNHETSVYFSINAILALWYKASLIWPYNFEIQNALASIWRTLWSWKAVNRCKFSISYAWWG